MGMDMRKYKKIIDKMRELGFNNFYQDGSPSRFHELNLIIEDKNNNIQYWICKSFGEFSIIYRKGINVLKSPQYRIKCEKTQKDVCEKFEELVFKLNQNKDM